MTVANPPKQESLAIDGRQFYEVVADLCLVADTSQRRSDYFSKCFELVAEFFQSSTGMLNLRCGARTLERSYEQRDGFLSQWHDDLDSLILRVQSNEAALLQKYTDAAGRESVYTIGAPILTSSSKAFGAVGLAIPVSRCVDGRSELALLNQLMHLIVVNAPTEQAPPDPKSKQNALQAVVRAADYKSIHQLCFAIVNSLCSKLGCEQVAIGLVKGNDVKLMAVSGLGEIPKSTPGMQAVHQSMATCLDRNEISIQQEAGRLVDQYESTHCKVHQLWHQIAGNSCVATVPLRIDGHCVAILALRRKPHSPFVAEDIKRAQVLGETFAPALPLVDKASRSIVKHCLDSGVSLLQYCYSWNGIGRKLFAASILLSFAWMLFGKTQFEVLAPCKIAAKKIITVASPYDGLVQEVLVQPGQRIRKGDLLLRFGKDDLQTERNRVLTDIATNRIECNALLQQRKAQDAFLVQAKLAVLKAELKLIEQKLNRASVRAQVDGIVLPTDIHRRIGQFVVIGEPLLEIADENDWHLEIETPEHKIRHLQIGQQGRFQSRARPDLVSKCKIDAINPSSQIIRDNNVVVADAAMDTRQSWMKIGMEGFVKIETGQQPIWWVYLHPVFDYARLRLWL